MQRPAGVFFNTLMLLLYLLHQKETSQNAQHQGNCSLAYHRDLLSLRLRIQHLIRLLKSETFDNELEAA